MPQRLKPGSFQSICVRPEGRTLQKDESFRCLYSPIDFVVLRPLKDMNFQHVRRNRNPLYAGTVRLCTARRRATRASSRVESSVGSGEFASFMISGISVQPSTTASQPSSFIRSITF
jgi:hypothetical protein